MSTRTNVGRLALALLLGAAPLPLLAGSLHYLHGSNVTCVPPSSTATGTSYSYSCSGGLVAGLGNGDILVVVSFTATADTFCHNKGNPANIVPGQNPAIAAGGQATGIPGGSGKNGSTAVPPVSGTFNIATPTPSGAGCPNDTNWTVTLGTVAWTAHYSFQQPPGTEIASLSFDF